MTSLDDPFQPHDPLGLADRGHAGVRSLHTAARELDSGDLSAALEAAAEARRIGLPAELAPYLALVQGVALVRSGDAADAIRILEDAWSAHPDVAALPAALGAAQVASGDTARAAKSMFASLVSDDPDQSLALHRRRLTLLLGVVRGERP